MLRLSSLSLVAALLAGCAAAAPDAPPSIVVPPAEVGATVGPGARSASPCRPAPPPPAPDLTADRARLAVGLDSFLAEMVASDRTELVARAAPFLARGVVWDLLHYGHAHPFFAHLGELPGAPSVALTSPASLVAFARGAGLVLDTDAARVAYVKTFFALDPDVVTLLESGADIHYTVPRERAEVKSEMLDLFGPEVLVETDRRRHVEDHLAPAIAPLCLRGAGPFHGVAYAIERQQRLVRIEVTLDRSGVVAVQRTLLADRVPVPAVYP